MAYGDEMPIGIVCFNQLIADAMGWGASRASEVISKKVNMAMWRWITYIRLHKAY
jgi:hypothetical protein